MIFLKEENTSFKIHYAYAEKTFDKCVDKDPDAFLQQLLLNVPRGAKNRLPKTGKIKWN